MKKVWAIQKVCFLRFLSSTPPWVCLFPPFFLFFLSKLNNFSSAHPHPSSPPFPTHLSFSLSLSLWGSLSLSLARKRREERTRARSESNTASRIFSRARRWSVHPSSRARGETVTEFCSRESKREFVGFPWHSSSGKRKEGRFL